MSKYISMSKRYNLSYQAWYIPSPMYDVVTHLRIIAVRCHPLLRWGQTPLPYAPFVRLPWARPHFRVWVCPSALRSIKRGGFLFFENIFGGNPSSITPHHTPTGQMFATLRESNLLSIVKPQYVVLHPHKILYLVVQCGQVGSV